MQTVKLIDRLRSEPKFGLRKLNSMRSLGWCAIVHALSYSLNSYTSTVDNHFVWLFAGAKRYFPKEKSIVILLVARNLNANWSLCNICLFLCFLFDPQFLVSLKQGAQMLLIFFLKFKYSLVALTYLSTMHPDYTSGAWHQLHFALLVHYTSGTLH